jgi:hypothetical protein
MSNKYDVEVKYNGPGVRYTVIVTARNSGKWKLSVCSTKWGIRQETRKLIMQLEEEYLLSRSTFEVRDGKIEKSI